MDAQAAGNALVQKVLEVGIKGAGPMKGAVLVADEHLRQHRDPEAAIRRLVRTHQRVVGTTGFAAGFGGFLTMPVTIPTDMGILYAYQTRMAAAIAHLRGYDLTSDEVQSVVLVSLLGAGGAGLLSKFGVELANKSAAQALKRVPGRIFIEINKKVGYRLITKGGTKGLVNMSKVVPVAGGIAGAGLNVASTSTVATYARRNFPRVGLGAGQVEAGTDH
jgi:hypothetical protein